MKQEIYITAIIFVVFSAIIGGGFLSFSPAVAEESTTVEATAKISICGNDVAEGGEHCDNEDLKGKACSDLGFSSGDLSCSGSCEFITSACTTSAEATDETDFTSSSGGETTITNNSNQIKITLSENFYTADVRLHGFSYANNYFSSSKPALSGKSFIGKTYDLVFIDTSANALSTLSQSATLVLTYTDANVSGINESSLAPYQWGSSDSSWQLISGATVNTTDNTVTFSTAQFSSFALFGEEEEEEEEESSGGGGGGGSISRRTPEIVPKPKPKPESKPSPDFNKDSKVNIVDLSIMLYWFGKTGPEIILYDLRQDNKIDIADVSILFYYWKD